METIEIERLTTLSNQDLDQLSELLIAIVDQGASVGYLPPLETGIACTYWRHAISADNIVLLVARRDGSIVGTVQLDGVPRETAAIAPRSTSSWSIPTPSGWVSDASS